MKLLHIIASCDPAGGGPIEGVFRLGEAFRAFGAQSEMLTLDRPDDPWVAASPIPVHAKGAMPAIGNGRIARLRNWANYSPEATEWLRANLQRYDGVIVDGLWNYSTRVARKILPDSGVPYLVFPHGMLDPYFRRQAPLKHLAKTILWQFNEGVLLRKARAVAFTTDEERRLASANWRPWGMAEAVVGYGTAEPPVGPAECSPDDLAPGLAGRPYLLFMSRLHPKKGCEILLDAFATTARSHDHLLVMAGPGDPAYVDALKARAESLGTGGRVVWPGMLLGHAKWCALHHCTALALTSHQENFGVIVAEALACARPVLISDQVNIHREVAAADAGLVCRTDARDAAEAIARLIAMTSADRAEMGQRGRALFAESFAIGRVAGNILRELSR